MNRRWLPQAIVAVAVLVLVMNTFFIVEQREQAIVLRFGEPVRVINAPRDPSPGLKIKAPFIENVVKLDKRNQSLISEEEEIISAGQDRLVVDSFVRYRISEPLRFYETLRDENTARDRIETLVNSSLRQILGSAPQSEIISQGRGRLMELAKQDVAQRAAASRLGIQIIDVRIRRVDFPEQNEAGVYRRMRTEREQQAAQNRALGEQRRRELIAQADREVAVTLATAREEAGRIQGEGDAARTRIFGQSFGRDPGFAAFYRSMQAYEASLAQGDTTLVLSPDSAFFRYFERGPTGGR